MTGARRQRELSRRQLVQGAGAVGLGLLAGCGRLSWPGQTPAQLPRVGYLRYGSSELTSTDHEFLQGLRELGYVEGQNVVIDYRFAETNDQLPAAAADLVRIPVDVILASTTPAMVAAHSATTTIPIVVAAGNPVGAGLAASLARPGGNVTGVTAINEELTGKRLELLKELRPATSRIAVLWTPANPAKVVEFVGTQRAAETLGIQLQSLEVRAAEDLATAFEAATRERAEALMVLPDPILSSHYARTAEVAIKHGWPSIAEGKRFPIAGGLMAYGPSDRDLFGRAATYVAKILQGAKPVDLPVEQLREFDFIINLRTAQGLGLTIPHHVLLQATEVIR
jgi:putative tryptophan/tyrosine transport system substrate-binding protein